LPGGLEKARSQVEEDCTGGGTEGCGSGKEANEEVANINITASAYFFMIIPLARIILGLMLALDYIIARNWHMRKMNFEIRI